MAAEAIEMLIELVREREVIYNAKHESHMDATMLANVWESIAKTVNVEGMDQSWNEDRTYRDETLELRDRDETSKLRDTRLYKPKIRKYKNDSNTRGLY